LKAAFHFHGFARLQDDEASLRSTERAVDRIGDVADRLDAEKVGIFGYENMAEWQVCASVDPQAVRGPVNLKAYSAASEAMIKEVAAKPIGLAVESNMLCRQMISARIPKASYTGS
jgi:hypothetical protein